MRIALPINLSPPEDCSEEVLHILRTAQLFDQSSKGLSRSSVLKPKLTRQEIPVWSCSGVY